MQNVYIPDAVHSGLVADLANAFLTAATGNGDLHGKIAEALAVAGVMPEGCREDGDA